MRTEITRQIVRNGWPILGLSAYTPEIEAAVMESANAAIFDYGLGIVGLVTFAVTLAEEDEDRLKKLAKDVSYTQLAGGFQQYAAGEALLGAGEGMAHGGGGVAGALPAARPRRGGARPAAPPRRPRSRSAPLPARRAQPAAPSTSPGRSSAAVAAAPS